MKIVYIAHPIGGNVKRNLQRIEDIVRHINIKTKDVIPFAPYWLDCHALDDAIREERERGIRNNAEYFKRKVFDELWLFGDRISEGMKHEIELAESLGIPVVCKSTLFNYQSESK